MLKSNSEVIAYINKLKNYRGYVQFSHRPLTKNDIFEDKDPNIKNEKGFVYEAHFSNDKESIMIRQQNAVWVVSKTPIVDIESKDIEFYTLEKTSHLKDVKSNWVKMAQIWKDEEDKLCELEKGDKGKIVKGFMVKKLKKVVFAGFSVIDKIGEPK